MIVARHCSIQIQPTMHSISKVTDCGSVRSYLGHRVILLRTLGVKCGRYPRLGVLSNPLTRVMFREKALDCFRFAIGPQNINPPASSGIFPREEGWSLLEHSSNMRLWRPGSRQLSCHNQIDRLAKAD